MKRIFTSGLLALLSVSALADSTLVYDPFEVPQGAYQATHIEDRDFVSIIEFSGNYDKTLPSGDHNAAARAVVAREFYRTHADNYDFLVVFSDFEFKTGRAKAFYNPVRNDVQGIGKPQFDLSSIYGSEGKLQGYIDMAALSRYELNPLKPDYDSSLLVLAHEVLHRWGVSVRFRDDEGKPNNSLIGHQDAHWSFKVDSSASVEYGHAWRDLGGGLFKAIAARRFYGPMDLYLMGFYSADEVEPFFYIDSDERDRTELPQPGVTISGVAKTVTIDDIIAVEGPRIPSAENSQKEFKFAFVYLKSPSNDVDSESLLALKRLRESFTTRFSILTGGRSIAHVYPEAKPAGQIGDSGTVSGGEIRDSATSVPEALAWLRNAQTSEGYWQDRPATRLRDTTLLFDVLTTYDPSFQRLEDTEGWLRTQTELDNDSLARRMATRRSELEREGDLKALLERRNSDGGWGVSEGYRSDVMDTALVLRAIASTVGSDIKSDAVNYLLEHQGDDGGWPAVESAASQVTVTALAMEALHQSGVGGDAVLKAADYLKGRQLADGGFGTSASTVHDTAHVILALLKVGQLDQIDVAEAASFMSDRQTIAGDWNGSVYTTALAVSAIQSANFANWAITEIKVSPEGARDGERVRLSALIANDGREATEPTVLRVYQGGEVNPDTQVSEDIPVPVISPQNAVSVDFYWDSLDHPGTNEFTFSVDPDDSVVERSELDNTGRVTVDILPAPEGVDLELNDGAVSIAPDSPYYIPSDLSISVALRNAGSEPAEQALVRLLKIEDGKDPVTVSEQAINVPARQTSVVNFVDQLQSPGTARYQAIADPAGAIEEANEANNTGTASVTPRDTIDFVVSEESVSMQPLSAYVGEDIEFTVAIRNQGSLAAPPSKVRYSLVSNGEEQLLRENNIVLGAGESLVHTLPWRVDTTGAKQLVVEMDPAATVIETDEDNNRYVFEFNADILEGTNVGVSYEGISVSPAPLLEGYGATLSAEVKNNGTVELNGVDVTFYNGSPGTGGVVIGSTTLASILPGERVSASVVWNEVPDSSEKLIYVDVDPDNEFEEFDETDNVAFQTFAVKALPDFVVGQGSITITPVFPKQGEQATITVSVNNSGIQPGAEVPVQLYQGAPGSGGVLIGEQTIASIEGQGLQEVSFDYLFDNSAENVRLVALVNGDRAIQEKSYQNNRAERVLTVQNNNFYVTERFISPDGDGVKDSSRFSFRLESAQDVVVSIKNSRGREVISFSGEDFTGASSGNIVWNGRNDFGGIVNDDEYSVEVLNQVGEMLGSSTIVVDTNRSSLLKAEGTQYERITDLSALIEVNGFQVGNFQYTPNDEFSVFFGRPGSTSNPNGYVTGIYRSTVYGGQLTPLVDFSAVPELNGVTYISGEIKVSPKSDSIAFRYRDNIWSVDIQGGPVRKLLSESDLEVDYQGQSFSGTWSDFYISNDGNWLIYLKNIGSNIELGRVAVDGASEPERLIVFDGYSDVYGIWPSPASNNLYVLLRGSDGGDLHFFDMQSPEPRMVEEFGNYYPSSNALAWAPDGHAFAMGDRRFARLTLLDASGEVIEQKPFYGLDGQVSIPDVRWNQNSLELAYEVERARTNSDRASSLAASGTPEGEPLEGNACDGSGYEPVSGIYIWNTATGEINHPIPVTEITTCDDGYGGYGGQSGDNSDTFAYFVDQEDQFWLYENPSDWEWSPGERRIIVLPRKNWQVVLPNELVAVDVEREGEFEEIFKFWPDQNIYDVEITPTRRRMFIDDIAFESLLNLSLDLRALRSRAAGGVQLAGTVADLNFDYYELDYAVSGETGIWKSVTPDSIVPVVDEEITVWVPPAPGSYYLRLTARDKAGNLRRNIKRTSWGEQASITDLYRDPGYISPNGDGVQDVVTLHMRVLQPVNLTLEVYNEQGQVVRTIRKSFDLIGAEESIVWDGRDDQGIAVEDGVYRLELGKYKYEVTVDSTVPDIELAPVADLLQPYPDCNPLIDDNCRPLVTLDLEGAYSFDDENYHRFRVEMTDEEGHWTELMGGEFDHSDKVGSLNLGVHRLNRLGRTYRIVVDDLAGNSSVRNFDFSPKTDKVILTHANPHLDEHGIQVRRNSWLPYASYDIFPEHPSAVEYNLTRFNLVESLQAHISSVSVLYREKGQSDSGWKELLVSDFVALECPRFGSGNCPWNEQVYKPTDRTENKFEFLVDLSQLNPSTDYEIKAKLVDQDGNTYTSNGLLLTQTFSFRVEGVVSWGEGTYEILTDIKKKPFDIFDAYILVESAGDPRYLKPTRIDVTEVEHESIEAGTPPVITKHYLIHDVIPCTEYTFKYVLVDEFGNSETSEDFDTVLGCTKLQYVVRPEPLEECGAGPSNLLNIQAGVIKTKKGEADRYQVLALQIDGKEGEENRVLFTKNNPEIGKYYQFDFDTSGYPEGMLDVTIRAVKESGEAITERLELPIDHTPPELTVLSPENEGKVCAAEFIDSDDEIIRGALVRGDLLDRNGAALAYKFVHQADGLTGRGSSGFFMDPTAITKLNSLVLTNDQAFAASADKPGKVENALRFVGSGEPVFAVAARQSLSGNLKAIGNVGFVKLNDTSEIDFTLEVTDFGTYKQCLTQSFYLDASIEGLGSSSRYNLISPNGDGILDQGIVDVALDEDATIGMAIHPAVFDAEKDTYTVGAPALFSVYDDVQVGAGNMELEWDGTNGGEKVADGHYFMVVTVRDACGNTDTLNHLVEVDATLPTVEIAYPNTGDPVSLNTEIVGSVSDKNLTNYRLEYQVGGDGNWVFIASGRTNVINDVLGTWNTFGLEGDVALRLYASDSAGNEAVAERLLNIEERTDLLSFIDRNSPYISPNGDNVKDHGRIVVGVLEPVSLEINLNAASGELLSQLVSGLEREPGEFVYTWDGTSNQVPVNDGKYFIEVIARSLEVVGQQQTESVPITVDTVIPTLAVHGIEDGFAISSIRATVGDAHLESYTYSRTDSPSSPSWAEVLSGTEPVTNELLEALSPDTSTEGDFGLRLVARDLAGNHAEKIVPYVVDLKPPLVELTSPESGVVTGDLLETLEVLGSIEDAYFESYRVLYRSDGSDNEVELFSSNSLPVSERIASVSVANLPEGGQVLVVEANDQAGHVSRQEVAVEVDHSDPVIQLIAPENESYVTGPFVLKGSVEDASLDVYAVDYAAGWEAANDASWTTVVQGTRNVSGGNLAHVSDLPADGLYTLRVLASDRVGHESEVAINITIDTQPPPAPELKTLNAVKDQGVEVTWSAVEADDLAGYLIERSGTLIVSEPVTDTEMLDPLLSEGTYGYRVIAVDKAGNRSAPSGQKTIRVDWTPPDVSLTNPTDSSLVSGLLNVRGTAYSEEDFAEYRISVGIGSDPQGWQLVARSTLQQIGAELAQWDTLEVDDSQPYTLRLEAEDLSGNAAETRIGVTVDNTAPAAPTGLSATATGSDVSIGWDANTEDDLDGYYLFVNGRLINAEGTVVGDLSPYVLDDVTYEDPEKADGNYQYLVYAVDKAGNVSGSSEPVDVDIETGPPHILFNQPDYQDQFENTLLIEGVSEDIDIAVVDYRYRLAGSSDAWQPIAEVGGEGPYIHSWDTSALAYGDYELAAIATDVNGNVDPDPSIVTVSRVDLTRPAQVTGVGASVNGGDVEVIWTANTEDDLAGYFIERYSDSTGTQRLNSQPLAETSYIDSEVTDELYTYRVIAVDLAGNESAKLGETEALVYTPAVEAPFSPTSVTLMELKGHAPESVSGVAEGTIENILGLQNLPVENLDGSGGFQWESIGLQPGENNLTVKVVDESGNRSKDTSYLLVQADRPTSPKDVSVLAEDRTVSLNWSANPEANIAGYRVFYESGEPILDDVVAKRIAAEGEPRSTSYSASKAIDGSIYSYYQPGSVSDGYSPLTVTLDQSSYVSRVNLIPYSNNSSYLPDAYEIQVWTGHYWLSLAASTNGATSELEFDAPYMTDRIRLVFNAPCPWWDCRIAELQVFEQPLISTIEHVAENEDDGVKTYAVTAVNTYGLESAPSMSSEVAVGDVQPPEPVVLSGEVVDEHDASLMWEPSGSQDANGYRIYRGGELIATKGVSTLQFVDSGLKNGVYAYHVVTEDSAGNLSEPSNVVSLEVAAPVESAPASVAVFPLPEGEKLQIDWQHGNPADLLFRLYRAESVDGPYEEITSTQARSFLDEGLLNGKEYFYQVTASDWQGNVSEPSTAVKGIPADSLSPEPPILVAPVVGGNSKEVKEAQASIIGFTEPGARVATFLSGNMGTPVIANAENVVSRFPYQSEFAGALSPNGRNLLLASDARMRVVEVSSGEVVWFKDDVRLTEVAWINDVRAVGYGYNVDVNRYRPIIIDVEKRTVDYLDLPGLNRSDVRWMDYSIESGEWILLIESYESFAESGLRIVDPVTGEITAEFPMDEWGYRSNTMKYSLDARMLAWMDSTNSNRISLLNLDTGERIATDLDVRGGRDTIAWKDDGELLLYIAGDGTPMQYDIGDGSAVSLPVDVEGSLTAVHWGTGDTFFVKTFSTLYMGDLPGNEMSILYQNSDYDKRVNRFEWISHEGLISFISSRGDAFILEPEGRFVTAPVTLADGENPVFAIAQDVAGNESDPSDIATLIYRQADNPDFAVSSSMNPRIPVVSDTVEIDVEVSNLGELTSPESTLSVVIVSPEGNVQALLDRKLLSPLAAGASMPERVIWQVPAHPGDYNLIVTVDEQALVQEVSESNNTIIRTVPVLESGGVALKTSLNRSNFASHEELVANVEMINPGGSFDGVLSVWIEDEQGYNVATLIDSHAQGLLAGNTEELSVDWNTGTIFAGNYELVARIKAMTGETVAESSSAFAIDLVVDPVLAVGSNRATYGPNELVTVNAHVSNEQANSSLGDLDLLIRVVADGGSVLHEHVESISEINPGDVQSFTTSWNTANTAPGEVEVVAELRDSAGEQVADAVNLFTIKPGLPVLPATLDVGGSRPVGEPLLSSYSVTNEGNSVVNDLQLTVAVLRPDDGALIAEDSVGTALAVGESYSAQASFMTNNLPLGQYKVQLIADYHHDGVPQRAVLASGFVMLFDADAPLVSILGPQASSVVNGRTAKAAITASDSLSGIEQVELQVDGSDWILLPPAAVNYFYDLDQLTEGPHVITARATDRAGNLSDPVSVSFTIDNEVPGISVNGVEENGQYNHAVSPEIVFEGATQTRVQLNGQDFVSGTPVSEEGDYRLYAYAEDDAGNNARLYVNFVVDLTAPLITIEGVSDGDLYNEPVAPEIRVEDTNLDGFEVKLNDQSYSSGDLIESDGVYTLSVVATDKAGNSRQASYAFEVDTTAPDAPVVTNVSDGDVLDAGEVTLIGEAEPQSIVDLRFGDESLSTLTDDTGAFAFADLDLDEGSYTFVFFATDRAGNTSEESRLNVVVRPKKQLNVQGYVTAGSHVLVWVPEHPGHHRGHGYKHRDNDFDKLIQLIGTTYELSNVDYRVVRNESDFVRELRSQRYNVLLIGSLKPALGHPLKMSYSTELEIRGVVGAGTGLVWINNHPNLFEFWHDVIGARSFGALPHIERVHLDEGPASQEGSWEYEGHHGVRVALTGGVGVGQLELGCKPHWHLWTYSSDCSPGWWKHDKEHKNPALVINKYGAGSVAMFTFNPGELVNGEVAQMMIREVTNYTAPAVAETTSESMVDIEWRITEAQPPLSIAALQKVSESLEMVGAVDGDVVDPQTVTWTRDLTIPATTLSSQVRLKEDDNEAGATIEVYDTAIGAGTLLAQGAVEVNIDFTQDEIELSYMDTLEDIDYSLLEYWSVHKAMIYAQAAMSRDLSRRSQLEWAIWDVKKSLSWLSHVEREKTGEAIVWGGRLLKHYQALWDQSDHE